MENQTIRSNGKNRFQDYTFSALEWSAPTMASAEEIKSRLDNFCLAGRKITELRMIGLNYALTRDWIEESAYNALPEDLPDAARRVQSDYEHISPALEFPRSAGIDEPLLIRFEDDDVFEITTPREPTYRFSMNCIPWFIDAGTNMPNVDANILFAPCIGKRITEVAVDTCFSDTKQETVSRIVLWLEDGVGLCISGWYDYCSVACIDRNDVVLPISFAALKPALFNWEDMHTDTVVGFAAHNRSLYFGKIGAEHTEQPYMTLVPSNTNTALHIAVVEFNLFAWSMTNVFGTQFDEYGKYTLSYAQWNDILNEAHKILCFETFDALFDYMTAASAFGLCYMNYDGAAFWKNKDWYLQQYEDMKTWSALAVKPGDQINIYGF
ncbi:MAG: hypothetical protein ACI4LI_02280 [Candidatus Fimenecus sp.]